MRTTGGCGVACHVLRRVVVPLKRKTCHCVVQQFHFFFRVCHGRSCVKIDRPDMNIVRSTLLEFPLGVLIQLVQKKKSMMVFLQRPSISLVITRLAINGLTAVHVGFSPLLLYVCAGGGNWTNLTFSREVLYRCNGTVAFQSLRAACGMIGPTTCTGSHPPDHCSPTQPPTNPLALSLISNKQKQEQKKANTRLSVLVQ